MKIWNFRPVRKQVGVGFVEILITVVVVSAGLLSLARMQGGFLSSGGEMKARSEAVKLAEAKIEEMRNHAAIARNCDNPLQSSDYSNFVSSTTAENIISSNASFSRSWSVTPLTNPDRQRISVTVSWGSDSVTSMTEISLADLCLISSLATGGNGLSGQAPSPNNVSSDVSDVKFKSSEISETALTDGSGLKTYTDLNGDIYLLKTIATDAGGNDLQALIKFKGGVMLSIKGAVYSGSVSSGNNPTATLSSETNYPIAFSDLAYCVFPVPGTASGYICYFGGDCKNGGAGCPNDYASQTYEAVQGGWYGKVGVTETSTHNLQNKKVCFSEDIAAGDSLPTAMTTARIYVTRRLDANNNIVGSEGINQSFECHNFLIVNKRGSAYPCSSFEDYIISGSSSKLAIPSSVVQRTLAAGSTNVVQSPDNSHCGLTSKYVVQGFITGTQKENVEVSINGQGCLITNDYNSYICYIETTATSVTLTAAGGNASPATQTISLSAEQLTGATLVTTGGGQSQDCLWNGSVVSNGQSITAYQTSSVTSSNTCVSETRTCTDGALSGTYAFASCVVEGTSTCSASISGSIVRSNGGIRASDSSVIVSSSPPGGNCTKSEASNNIATYNCSIGTVADQTQVTISGQNVTGGQVVTVDCLSPVNNSGPTLTTIK
jgi:Tfp pilus assembly protein PilV